MTRRGIHPAAAVVIACLGLGACDIRRPADPAEGEVAGVGRAVREVNEAQRTTPEPEKMTRQQAMAEYRKCTRTRSGQDRNLCQRWKDLAYPPSSHILNTPPEPARRTGNYAPDTEELRKAMHAPVDTFTP